MQGANHTWKSTELFGTGWPSNGGGRLVGSLAGLPYALAEAEQNFLMRIREREQRLIKKIDEALERMDQNTYGICERCEEEIPYPRLKARPVTTLCINCKTLEEQEEKARR